MVTWHTSELVLCALNVIVVLLICFRLQIFRTGLFTVGFINIFTALIPHFILFPIYAILTGHRIAQSTKFYDALVLIFVQLVSLLIGTLIVSNHKPLFTRRLGVYEPYMARVGKYALWGLILCIVAFIGIRWALLGIANPLKLLQYARTDEFRQYWATFELGYASYFLAGSLFFLQGLLVWLVFRKRKDLIGLFLAVCVTAIVAGTLMITGSRSDFFLPILIFLYITNYYYRKVPIPFISALVIACVPVFVFLRILASGNTIDSILVSDLNSDSVFIATEFVERFSNIESITEFLHWSDTQGDPIVFGKTLAQFPLRPIPRTLLPNKPASLDVFLSREIFGPAQYGSISIFGGIVEMYYNFWYFGVIAWFILVGALLYRLHFGTLEASNGSSVLPVLLVICNPSFLRGLTNMGITTSGTQQLLITLATQIALVIVMGLLIAPKKVRFGRKKRRRTSSHLPLPRGKQPTI